MSILQGTDREPGLIPRTLDLLFETLSENLETKREIYQYKPDKFNEICTLSDADLNTELNNKEILLRSSTYKVNKSIKAKSFNKIFN